MPCMITGQAWTHIASSKHNNGRMISHGDFSLDYERRLKSGSPYLQKTPPRLQ
ncbi:hypothetical protein RB6907 [Rhodopirellula baltica SH 1]|uniref:Uncharacterized protein n=1 Tax=Rhodopirellula baltica (strain DSM 10527 / NCIMB 13988 / SH1) TaxID=243090 RepID=Q7UPJ1_RHOBA|nr:hypothetical protein RB6907 [Rhodopirellula baltica SH 1]